MLQVEVSQSPIAVVPRNMQERGGVFQGLALRMAELACNSGGLYIVLIEMNTVPRIELTPLQNINNIPKW